MQQTTVYVTEILEILFYLLCFKVTLNEREYLSIVWLIANMASYARIVERRDKVMFHQNWPLLNTASSCSSHCVFLG